MSFIGYLTLAPLAAALAVLLLPKEQSRMAALALSSVIFLASLGMLVYPSADTNLPWIPAIDIRFHLAADGLNIWLVLLSTFLTPIVVGGTQGVLIGNPVINFFRAGQITSGAAFAIVIAAFVTVLLVVFRRHLQVEDVVARG